MSDFLLSIECDRIVSVGDGQYRKKSGVYALKVSSEGLYEAFFSGMPIESNMPRELKLEDGEMIKIIPAEKKGLFDVTKGA